MRWLMAMTMMLCAAGEAAAKSKQIKAGEHAGVVVLVNGGATIQNGAKKTPAKAGMSLIGGDTVVTGEAGKVKLLLDDDSTINLGSNTKFLLEAVKVDLSGERQVSLKILSGKFMAAVSTWFGSKSSWEVTTPTAVAGVRGTVLWGDTKLDAICALHGQIEVKSLTGSGPVELAAGDCATKMGEGKTDPLKPTPEQVAAYLSEVLAKR